MLVPSVLPFAEIQLCCIPAQRALTHAARGERDLEGVDGLERVVSSTLVQTILLRGFPQLYSKDGMGMVEDCRNSCSKGHSVASDTSVLELNRNILYNNFTYYKITIP